MNISKIGNKIYTQTLQNKYLLKTLENVSEHGTSYCAGISFLMSSFVRPMAISLTPNVEKENKEYAMSNSISSGIIKLLTVEAVALPIENAVKNIDENCEKFLSSKTIKRLFANNNPEQLSRSYKFMTQMVKLSAGIITAIPKSIVTVALIPIVMDKLFLNKKTITNNNQINQTIPQQKIPFTGNINNKISKIIAKAINNENFQDFAIKHQNNDKDIAKHITAGTDILLTTTTACQTMNSKKIKENRKKALVYNNYIATGITLGGGYGIDWLIKNLNCGFIEKFKQANINDPKLYKYIEGINILRPALIFAGIYYGILPMISTYCAEKIDKTLQKQ